MSVKGKVLVTGDSVAPGFLQQLEDAGLSVVNPPASFPPAVLTADELVVALRDCRAYLLGGDEIATADVLARTEGLEIISFLGVGYQSFVDAAGATAVGIPVAFTPGVLTNSVAEFTVGLLLEARRNIIQYATDPGVEQRKAADVAGHRIGIVGLGAIGTRIAEILTQGMHAKVSYFSRSRKPSEEDRLNITYEPLQTLVDEVEVLVIMVPETPETTGLIGADLLSRRTSDRPLTLINTARAEVVDPAALAVAVNAGAIDRVTFDGYYRAASDAAAALRALPGVRVTPHVASLTHDARDAMSQVAVDAIIDIVAGRTPAHIVNPDYARHQVGG